MNDRLLESSDPTLEDRLCSEFLEVCANVGDRPHPGIVNFLQDKISPKSDIPLDVFFAILHLSVGVRRFNSRSGEPLVDDPDLEFATRHGQRHRCVQVVVTSLAELFEERCLESESLYRRPQVISDYLASLPSSLKAEARPLLLDRLLRGHSARFNISTEIYTQALPGDAETILEVIGSAEPRTVPGSGLDLHAIDLSGREIGGYRFDTRIGAGGVGVIWKARSLDTDCDVAIKIPRRDRLTSAQVEDWLSRAERQQALIRNPLVVPVLAVHRGGALDGVCVMPLIQAPTLEEFLQNADRTPNSWPTVRESVKAVADLALSIADDIHMPGFVHGDLKPSNVFVERQLGNFRLLLADTDGLRTESEIRDAKNLPEFTPEFASPKLLEAITPVSNLQLDARRTRAITTQCDLVGIGLILYALLKGVTNPLQPDPGESAIDSRRWTTLPPVRDRPKSLGFAGDIDETLAVILKGAVEESLDSVRTFGERLLKWLDTSGEMSDACRVKVWKAHSPSPLAPAPRFEGRRVELNELFQWACSDSRQDRVLALVAPGGAGKTAIAERLIAQLESEERFGVFVWSLDPKDQVEDLLRAAYLYFRNQESDNEQDKAVKSGPLEQLQRALSSTTVPHLIVIDGLELFQLDGTKGSLRGALSEPDLKRLLDWLAAGIGVRTKVLVTSRFPLLDLQNRVGQGYRSLELKELDSVASRAILRRWNVKGLDSVLDRVAKSVQYHPLTLEVMGSYLSRCHNGDVEKAPSFDPQFLAGSDPIAARLCNLLEQYSTYLTPQEIELLGRLSLFPRGAQLDLLIDVITSTAKSGPLEGCTARDLIKLLHRLENSLLLSRCGSGSSCQYSIHPFIRDFFTESVTEGTALHVHHARREKYEASVTGRPGWRPTSAHDLDLYESLVDATRRSGDPIRAFEIYWSSLGGAPNLSWRLGEFRRGLRIVEGFSRDRTIDGIPEDLPEDVVARLLDGWGQYLWKLGELATARLAFEKHNRLRIARGEYGYASRGLQHLTGIHLHCGNWPLAKVTAEEAIRMAERANHDNYRQMSHAYLGAALFGLGDVAYARREFGIASRFEKLPQLARTSGIQESEFKLACGRYDAALLQAKANRAICEREEKFSVKFINDPVLALCHLPKNVTAARESLDNAREYAVRTGAVEVSLRCHHGTAILASVERDYPRAADECLIGIQLADSYGFGRWSIEIRQVLAQVHLAAGRYQEALKAGTEALIRCENADCRYAWGTADVLHTLGLASARLGIAAQSRELLRRAADIRRALDHPDLKQTLAELG